MRKQKGFTLIELMVSIAVTAIVISTAYFAWAKFFELGNQTSEHDLRLFENQLAWQKVERSWRECKNFTLLNDTDLHWQMPDGTLNKLSLKEDSLLFNSWPLFIRKNLQQEIILHSFLRPDSLDQPWVFDQDFDGNGTLEAEEFDQNGDREYDSQELKPLEWIEWIVFTESDTIYQSRSAVGLQRINP